jgi:Na+-driven multidrug efflux pump
MSTDEFQELWKAYDARLERSMEQNKRLLEEVRSQKMRTSFGWLLFRKFFMIVFGILWNVLCVNLAWHFRSEPVFVTAAALMILFTSLTICGYVVQVLLIAQINLTKTILNTQKQLAQLEAVIVATYRISILQAPLWTFFFLTKGMIAGMGPTFWIIQGSVTALFIVGVIWLYRHIKVENIDKKWMRVLLNGLGVEQIGRARQFIREIREFSAE